MQNQVTEALTRGTAQIVDAWTDITWLLYAKHVSWAYYVETGIQPDCDNDSAETCTPTPQSYRTPGIWNPLPLFEDVQKDHQLTNIKPLNSYFASAAAGHSPPSRGLRPRRETASIPRRASTVARRT